MTSAAHITLLAHLYMPSDLNVIHVAIVNIKRLLFHEALT